MTIDYNELTKKVLDLESDIRFTGVVNNKGELIAGGYNENIEEILNDHDQKMSIHYALQKRELYTNLAYKLGKEQCSITEYEKVTLITIPINSNELFLVSTEPRAEYFKIIDFVLSSLTLQNNVGSNLK